MLLLVLSSHIGIVSITHHNIFNYKGISERRKVARGPKDPPPPPPGSNRAKERSSITSARFFFGGGLRQYADIVVKYMNEIILH